MDGAPTITRIAPALPSKDYALLRQAGIEHLRRLAGKVWTDHNLHDPGITMLEALCYAITEIGHRIDQPVVDLLYSHPSGAVDWSNLFFPANVILPNCPLTIKDYRKLLLDIQINYDFQAPNGLRFRDVFLLKSETAEQKCYVQMKTNGSLPPTPETLTYESTALSALHYTEAIRLNGLYAVLVEFDTVKMASGESVDLNSSNVIRDIQIGTDTYTFDFAFPHWDTLADFEIWGNENINISSVLVTSGTHRPFGDLYDYTLEFQVVFSNGATVNNFPASVKILSAPVNIVDEDGVPNTGFEMAEESFEILFLLSHFGTNTLLSADFQNYIKDYKFRIGKINKLLTEAKRRLYGNRNLCEDYFSFKGVRTQQIATCGNIELLPGADPNQVLLEISVAISEFFSPTYRHYSWQELLEEGRTLEQIFEGPLPAYGFIKDEDLDPLQRANAVYTSDLINLIMDVPGVLAVHQFKISNYIGNKVVVSGASDCIQLISKTVFLPRFDILRSLDCLTCRKEGVVVLFDKMKIREDYEARMVREMIQPFITTIPYPSGQTLPLEEYYSIQHDLPLTYGVGLEGLAPSETDLRKAQAKQLKGYLLFFDQLLANFLSQLVQLKDYFSMSDKIDRTYFYQPLYEVPRVDELLASYSGGSWSNYIANSNTYTDQLRDASEDEYGFEDRRNRFTDHILARFAEDFTQYSIALFDHVHPNTSLERLAAGEQLIADKIDFLKYLPEISRCRARAFNYRIGELTSSVWDSGNVSGLEKRVCKKLGFDVWDRRNLYWNYQDTFFDNGTTYSFTDGDGNVLLEGPSSVLANYSRVEILQAGLNPSNYYIFQQFGLYFLSLNDSNGMLLASSPLSYATANIATQNRARIIRSIQLHYNSEGFHLLEHILLRPRYYVPGVPADSDLLLSGTKFRCTALKDPYSFVATIVFSSGYERDFSVAGSIGTAIAGTDKLRDSAFRRFAERTVREEMPAHIFCKIFWLDTDTADLQTEFSMNNFERVFKAWLDKFCNPASSIPDLIHTEQELVAILAKGWTEICPPPPP